MLATLPNRQSTEHRLGTSHPFAVFDGLNVMYAGGGAIPKLQILLDAVLRFLHDGYDILCVCDANTRHVLRECHGDHVQQIYDSLHRKFPQQFVESPAGRKADPFVLSEANARNALVVSTDLFRDYSRQFNWIEDPARFVKVLLIRDHYYLDEARFPIPADIPRLALKLGVAIRYGGLQN